MGLSSEWEVPGGVQEEWAMAQMGAHRIVGVGEESNEGVRGR